MKKRIFLFVAVLAMLMCFFAIVASAETPSMYIEFGARFPGSDEYVTVYTENAESKSNPQINFATKKFYSDVEFTNEVDMSTATGIDFSVTKSYVDGVQGNAPNRMTKPSSPFVNCVEVKWFLEGFPTVSYNSSFFKGWTGLKSFDFGNATAINDNTFEGCGFESITIPASVTSFGGSIFKNCTSLKSVKIEGVITKFGNGSTFYKCTELDTVDLGPNTTIGKGMFYGCTKITEFSLDGFTSIGAQAFRETGITSIIIPKEITNVGNEAFCSCKSLTSVVFEEGFSGTLGSSAFMGTHALTTLTLVEGIKEIPSQCFWSAGKSSAIEKVTLPDSVETLKGRAFNSSTIKVLEIRETSNLKSITGDAFAGMKYLQSIYLPTGVEITCDNLFQYCYELEKVENFENVKFNVSSYGENVFPGKTFHECLALKEIKIPNGVTEVAGTAFRYYGMERIYIPASVTSINSAWLNDTTHIPSTVTFFYCGGDANKLLSLTDDGSGNVSTRLSGMITNGSVAEYKGINDTYENGVIVYNVNTCDVYYGGIHLDSDKLSFKYVDKDGNPTDEAYVNALEVSCPCGRECGVQKVVKTIPALFICNGYSSPENGRDGIAIGFTVNNEAVKEYEKTTGKTLKYGVFAAAKDNIGNNSIFNSDGTVSDKTVVAEVAEEYVAFDFLLSGFTDANKDAKLAMGAYVKETDGENTEYSYIQAGTPNEGENYSFISYNDIVNASRAEA